MPKKKPELSIAETPEEIESTNGFHIPVIMSNPLHKANDDVKLTFNTLKTMSGEEFTQLRSFKNQPGWLVFKINEIREVDIPKEDTPDGRKSQAELMRNAMWVWWESLSKPGPQGMVDEARFELFYIDKMSMLREVVKSKIKPK